MPTVIDPPRTLTPARGTEWISALFHAWRTQAERLCAFEPCGAFTPYVLVFPAPFCREITHPDLAARQIPVCPQCAAECFGIEVISAALNVH